MKIYRNIIFILVVAMVAACHSPKEKSLENIRRMEANDSVFSPKAIEDLKSAYLDFADKYPQDELSPEYIFKAAQRCNATAQHEEAIELFQRVIDTYPKSKLCEEALFLQAYIYENSMQKLDKAKKIYLEFINKYPESDLTEDAKLAIENLGRSPEEIFESFRNKKDSAS